MSSFYMYRNLRSRLLVGITLCVTLTLVLSTTVYYFYYVQVEQEQAFEANHAGLMRRSREVNNMTSVAQSLAFQMYRSSTLSKLLYYPEPIVYDVTGAMAEMNNYLSSMPYIESIYVYNAQSNTVYIASNRGQNGIFHKEELADKGILQIMKQYQNYKPFTPIPRVYSVLPPAELAAAESAAGASQWDDSRVAAYTYLCYDAINAEERIQSAIIVNVSAAWMNTGMAAEEGNSSSAIQSYILNDQGRLLSAGTLIDTEANKHDRGWLTTKIYKQSSGYFIDEFQGRKSLISFTSPDQMHWQYISITPYESVISTTSSLRNTMLFIAFMIAVAGLAASWKISRILYKPINRMLAYVNRLESEKRNSMYTIRQSMLLSMVRGNQSMSEEKGLTRRMELGITFPFHEDYRLVLIHIDEYLRWQQERGPDLLPYKFAIMNIASEIGGQAYRVETIDAEGAEVILLLHMESATISHQGDDSKLLLEAVLRQIREACLEYLRLSISTTYSQVSNQPQQLPTLYLQVQEAMEQRYFLGNGIIVDAKAMEQAALQHTYYYPADKEKKLLDYLRSGHTDEAYTLLQKMIAAMQGASFSATQIALSRLVLNLQQMIGHIEEMNGFKAGVIPQVPVPEAFDTVTEWQREVEIVFSCVRQQLLHKRSTKQEQLVEQIQEKINRCYGDADFCLNQIAEELDRSPVYISRIYKQQMMITIVDALQRTRIEKACQLLLETDWPVADIAMQTGFASTSYFHRMFKRALGVTPTDYRRSRPISV